MPRSIRRRLQAWYGLVLLIVVAGLAGVLYYQARAAQLQEADASLEAAALYLDLALRRFPPFELDREGATRPPPPLEPADEVLPDGWPPPPRPPDRGRLLAEHDLPGRVPGPGPSSRMTADHFGVWRADGTLLKASGLPEERASTQWGPFSPGRPVIQQRGEFRQALLRGPRQTRILVGRSMRPEQAQLRAFAWRLTAAGAGVFVVGLLGGWLVSSGIVRPVAAIAHTAARISERDLSARIDPAVVDQELVGLATVLNRTFDRLEAAFARQARFTADAAHELRTPLAIIRGNLELTLSRPHRPEEYQQTLKACLAGSVRMTQVVDGLLTLARADAGDLARRSEPIALDALVQEAAALIRPVAWEARVNVSVDLVPVSLRGDAAGLAQVITNLLTNAVRYNHPDGRVEVRLRRGAGEAILSVTDMGPGIPEGDQPHIFERFYRVDKARSRASGGVGLGLAICKSIVEAHAGRMGFDTKPGHGSTFWVRLPVPDLPGPGSPHAS